MARGFAALECLNGTDPPTPSDVLKAVSTALASKIGGSTGPLYGAAFLRASTAVPGRQDLPPADVAAALEAALLGVKHLGKAEPGDKTMVDASTPAVEAAREEAPTASGAREVLASRDRGGGAGGTGHGPPDGAAGAGEPPR